METNTVITIGILAILIVAIVVAFRYRGSIIIWGKGHGFQGGVKGTNENASPLPHHQIGNVRAVEGNALVRANPNSNTEIKDVTGGKDATVDFVGSPTLPKDKPPTEGAA